MQLHHLFIYRLNRGDVYLRFSSHLKHLFLPFIFLGLALTSFVGGASSIQVVPDVPFSIPVSESPENAQTVYLDINSDGAEDFSFIHVNYDAIYSYVDGSSTTTTWDSGIIQSVSSLTGLIDGNHVYNPGELVGLNAANSQTVKLRESYYTNSLTCIDTDCYYHNFDSYSNGLFARNSVTTGLVGFNFLIDQDTHWGWVELSIDNGFDVLRWGWETEAATVIAAGTGKIVPLPPAIGLFSAGLAGLFAVSRRRVKR